jgi:electron transfer flavoprotein alpha subunit
VTYILVLASTDSATDQTSAIEMVSGARSLAEMAHCKVVVVNPFGRSSERERQLIAYGADVVVGVEHPWLAEYECDCMLPVLEGICRRSMPQMVLMAADHNGRDLATRLAFRLRGSVVNNSTGVSVIREQISVTKPVYGGRATVTFVPRALPIVITVRRTSFLSRLPDFGRTGDIQRLVPEFDHDPRRVRLVTRVSEASRQRVTLETARIVVSGGRGLKGSEPFVQLEELARLLNGAVGASRAATDAGWISTAHQIGQTGRTVHPELYLAFGISGAVQHLAGMSSSKVIAAVNTDPEAPIFKIAHLGVVDDCIFFLPALISEIKRMRASRAYHLRSPSQGTACARFEKDKSHGPV